MNWLDNLEDPGNNPKGNTPKKEATPQQPVAVPQAEPSIFDKLSSAASSAVEYIADIFSDQPEAATTTTPKTAVKTKATVPTPTGLTNDLFLRQIYKESRFNPKAVSPKGFSGLAQIGKDIINDYLKATGEKKIDPFNPEDSIKVQKWAMNNLYNADFINKPNQLDQVRLAKTFAAYNWGRGNLSNFLNAQKKAGKDIYNSLDWVNELPTETSDYINKIVLGKDVTFENEFKKASANTPYSKYYKKDGGWLNTYADGGLTLSYWKDLDKQYYIDSDRTPREYATGGWTDLARRYGFYGQYPGYATGGPINPPKKKSIYQSLLDYKENPDENKWEFLDPTGLTSWDDAAKARESWRKSGRTFPTIGEGLDMSGVIPAIGMGTKAVDAGVKITTDVGRKIPWDAIINSIGYLYDEYTDKWSDSNKPKKHGLGSHVVHGGPTWPEYAMGLDSGATLNQTLDTLKGNPSPKILDTSAQGNLPKKAKYPSTYLQGVKKYSLPEEGRSMYRDGGRITKKGKQVRSSAPRISYEAPSTMGSGPWTQRGGVTFKEGGMIKRADGSYSRRGLWDNIRANKGSGRKPTAAMLEQERKIKASKKYADGAYIGDKPMTNLNRPAPKYNKTPDKAVMPVVYANEPNEPNWIKGAKFKNGGKINNWLDNL